MQIQDRRSCNVNEYALYVQRKVTILEIVKVKEHASIAKVVIIQVYVKA